MTLTIRSPTEEVTYSGTPAEITKAINNFTRGVAPEHYKLLQLGHKNFLLTLTLTKGSKSNDYKGIKEKSH